MSFASLSGRAGTNPENPTAHSICDRCGFRYNHSELSWQHQYAGTQLINLRLLVCRRCLDIPAQFLRTIILPPDPVPVKDPRPEFFAQDESANPPPAGTGVDSWRANESAGQPVYLLVPD